MGGNAMLRQTELISVIGRRPTWLLDGDGGSGGAGTGEGGEGEGGEGEGSGQGEGGGSGEGEGEKTPEQLAEEVSKWKGLARKHEDQSKKNAKAASELEKLRKQSESEQEKALREAEERGKTTATQAFAQQLAGARIEAALAGVVPDPAAIVEDLNLAKYVNDDGEIDTDAIDKLREKYVGMTGAGDGEGEGGKPKSKVDLKQGNKGKSGTGKAQLTRDELKKMSPDQIEAARLDGRCNDLLGITT